MEMLLLKWRSIKVEVNKNNCNYVIDTIKTDKSLQHLVQLLYKIDNLYTHLK